MTTAAMTDWVPEVSPRSKARIAGRRSGEAPIV